MPTAYEAFCRLVEVVEAAPAHSDTEGCREVRGRRTRGSLESRRSTSERDRGPPRDRGGDATRLKSRLAAAGPCL